MPRIIPLVLPLSVLLASIMTFGSFSENYELAAMKSSGISLQRCFRTLIVFISLLSIVAFMFANNVIPYAEYKFMSFRRNIAQVKPALAIAEGQFNTVGVYNIKVNKKSGDKGNFLSGVTIHKKSLMGDGNKTVIKAKTGELISNEESNLLQLVLKDGYYYEDVTPKKYEDREKMPFVKSSFKKDIINIDLSKLNTTAVEDTKEANTKGMLDVSELVYTIDSLSKSKATEAKSFSENINQKVTIPLASTTIPTNDTVKKTKKFNAKDPLYKAVESGAWSVNVFPVCEQFPCEEADFRGSWPDRFTYKYVKQQYENAVKLGKVDTFNQELMLRIMSEEDRLIQDGDIGWYKLDAVLRNKQRFNFYITTDFATSEKQKSDYSVISVWAYNNVGDWLWVDGICKRQLMDKNIDDLFRLAQMYKPQSVGVEVTGQQGGFISWIQNQMLERNIYFPLASEGNDSKPGIRPNTAKLVRFNTVVPLFKARKIFFPIERKTEPTIVEAVNELSLVSVSGFKSKQDDFLDTISMLSVMPAWKPSEEAPLVQSGKEDGMWDIDVDEVITDRMASYIV